MNSWLLCILWKSVLSQIIWYHFCMVVTLCWCVQEAFFARVQKSTCAKVMPTACDMLGLKWENELNVSNEMNCIYALSEAKSHTHTHARAQMFVDIWYSICVSWLILLGMLFGSAMTELIPKSQLFYSNITTLPQVDFCTLSQTMLLFFLLTL